MDEELIEVVLDVGELDEELEIEDEDDELETIKLESEETCGEGVGEGEGLGDGVEEVLQYAADHNGRGRGVVVIARSTQQGDGEHDGTKEGA
ncbi:hypothetical protein EDB85DRAFT_2138429 [Lactarius pseudohatsudake]|nr:hypothetical protein EDB85DRAFT_2138429 [Lactarius pseudohatsudake]